MARKLDRAADQERQLSDGEGLSDGKGRTDRRSAISRRSYLGASLVAALPTMVGRAQARTAERHGIGFRRVLDAVNDLGMDPTGGTPVDPAIAAAGDGTLIRFPDGTYRFDSDPGGTSIDGQTRGFEGAGGDVTFLVPEGRDGFLLDGVGMGGAYVDDVVVDRTASNTCGGLRLCGDHVVVRNVVAREGGDNRQSATPFLSVSTSRWEAPPPDRKETSGAGAGARPAGDRRELLVENLERTSRLHDGVSHSVGSDTDTLTIEGTGVATNYEITVDGRLEGETTPSGRRLSGSSSEGTIESDTTSYLVDGRVTDLRLGGEANIYLNDDRVDPDTLVSSSPDRLVFDASDGITLYAFSVTGLYPRSRTDPSGADSRTADSVSEGADVYRFDGNVESLSARGSATLTFDG